MRGMARVRKFGLMAGISAAGLMAILGGRSANGLAVAGLIATHTTASAETREVNGRTVATVGLAVASDAEGAATGAVTLVDNGKRIAGASLDAEGKVTFTVDGLTPGEHTLAAMYAGDASHAASKSEDVELHANATVVPDFTLAISATTMNIATPGDSGSLTATVTPVAGTGFTGFLSLSCSGPSISSGSAGGSALPFGVSCTYTPANLEVVAPTTADPTAAQSADLTIQTTAQSGTTSENRPAGGIHGTGSPLVLAILLPGVVGLGFLGRKRGILSRGAMLMVVGLIAVLGNTLGVLAPILLFSSSANV